MDGVNFLVKKVDLDVSNIKKLSFELGSEQKNLFIIFMAENNSKANLKFVIGFSHKYGQKM